MQHSEVFLGPDQHIPQRFQRRCGVFKDKMLIGNTYEVRALRDYLQDECFQDLGRCVGAVMSTEVEQGWDFAFSEEAY